MSTLGMFSPQGLMVTSEVWGQIAFTKNEDCGDARHLTHQLLEQLVDQKTSIHRSKSKRCHHTLYNNWQLPMYDFEFSLIDVSMAQLQEEQERILVFRNWIGE